MEEIDRFEEIIHLKQRRKHVFSFVNSFKPPGILCIFWWWVWVLVLVVSSFSRPIKASGKPNNKNHGKIVLNEEIHVHEMAAKGQTCHKGLKLSVRR